MYTNDKTQELIAKMDKLIHLSDDEISHDLMFATDFFRSASAFMEGDMDKCLKYSDSCFRIACEGVADEWQCKCAWKHVLATKEKYGYGRALDEYKECMAHNLKDPVLVRGYKSHQACMNLHINPSHSLNLYQEIVKEWDRNPDHVFDLPHHEYVDIAMASVLVYSLNTSDKSLLYKAEDSCEKAIKILKSNGLLNELGRAYNIFGCLSVLQGDLTLAENRFRESVKQFEESPDDLFGYRSILNLIQILCASDDEKNIDEARTRYKNAYSIYAKKYAEQLKTILDEAKYESARTWLSCKLIVRLGVILGFGEAGKIAYEIAPGFETSNLINIDYFPKSPFVFNDFVLVMG